MPKVSNSERSAGTFDELKAALKIDKYDLDNELVQLPDLFWRVSEQYTLACSHRDELKLEVAELRASLAKAFREEADAAKEKLTVDGLNAQIDTTPKMVDLAREFSASVASAARWGALKEAYGERSYALKSLVQLHGQNYFVVDQGSRPRSAAVDRVSDDIRNKAGAERRERLRPRED